MRDQTTLYRTIMAQMNRPGGFTETIGVTITHIGPFEARGELAPDSTHANPIGTVHGGAICTLMDAVGGAAGASAGYGCATIDCTLHFLCPAAPDQRLFCRAEAVKTGGRIQIFEVSVTGPDGTLCAKGTYTYQRIHPIESEASI